MFALWLKFNITKPIRGIWEYAKKIPKYWHNENEIVIYYCVCVSVGIEVPTELSRVIGVIGNRLEMQQLHALYSKSKWSRNSRIDMTKSVFKTITSDKSAR